MVAKAVELAEAHGWFLTRQFETKPMPTCTRARRPRDIGDDFEGERLDYWVTGLAPEAAQRGIRVRQGSAGDKDRSLRPRMMRPCSPAE